MNPRLTKAQVKWVRSLQQKKVRDQLGLFIAEGDKCVNDLATAFDMQMLITSDNATTTEIEQMSSLRTPQGTIAVFKKRNDLSLDTLCTTIQDMDDPLLLALDGIQDPGNLGTIIRTCDWFGIKHIICSAQTADCYNPKVVQATMGALARVNIHYTNNLAEIITTLQHNAFPIYGTLLEGRNMYSPESIPTKKKGVIVMGNEGNGLSDTIREIVTHPLRIPAYCEETGQETSESLNVGIATAIVLAEFRRKAK